MLSKACRRFVSKSVSSQYHHHNHHYSSLVLAEVSNGALSDASKSCIGAATQLSDSDNIINVLVCGDNCENAANEASKIANVEKVLYSNNAMFNHGLSENISNLIVDCAQKYKYSHILSPISSYSKDVLARCAGIMDISQISDVTQIINSNTFERSIYAGNAVCIVESKEKDTILMTIRASSFNDIIIDTNDDKQAEMIEIDISALNAFDGKAHLSDELSSSIGPSLSSATAVVSGGRGLKNGDNFKLLYSLSDIIPDCAVGASRAAVDAGFVSNDLQVGQTGKVVAPNVYIAVAISGAIQHIAGMKDSKLIFAINTDPEAPIFSIADYGLVADLFEVVPKLQQLIEDEKKTN